MANKKGPGSCKAKVICQRSGFAYYMDEMVIEPGTGWLVHKSMSDGEYNLVDHPLNHVTKLVKFGDPYPVDRANPEDFSHSARSSLTHDWS